MIIKIKEDMWFIFPLKTSKILEQSSRAKHDVQSKKSYPTVFVLVQKQDVETRKREKKKC